LVANPLETAYTSCYSCHPDDNQQRARELANEFGVTVSYHAPIPTTSARIVAASFPPFGVPPHAASTAADNSSDWHSLWWPSPIAAVVPLGWLAWKKRAG
jgi:hypothetical protein